MLHENFEIPISGIEEKYTFYDLSKIAHRNKNLLSSVCGYIQTNSEQYKESEHKNTVEDFKKLREKLLEFYFKHYMSSLQDEFFDNPQNVEPVLKKLVIDHEKLVYFIKQQLDVFTIEPKKESEINDLLFDIESIIRLLRDYLPEFKQKFKGLNELKKDKTKNAIPERKNLHEFFDELIDSEVSELEMYNYVDEVTTNFDKEKTEIISKDLELYLNSSKMELENDFNLNDLVGRNKQYKTIEEIPFTETKNHLNNTMVKRYDYEKLFYPHRFFNLYRLQSLLESKLKRDTIKDTPPPEPQTPFTDPKTHELFNYIVDNWVYNKDLRYAYIYNYLVDVLNYSIIQTDYEKFIRTKYNVGRVYFENANSQKRIEQIKTIVDNRNQI